LEEFKEGQWFFYYDQGPLSSIGSFQKGKKSGTWGYFYTNRQLKQEEYWNDGKLMNIAEFFSVAGDTLPRGTLKDGNGLRLLYSESGVLDAEENYKDGVPNGDWKFYHQNGTLASQGKIVEGEKDGKWTYYHSNGQKESEGEYKSGIQVGSWYIYNRRGRVVDNITFYESE